MSDFGCDHGLPLAPDGGHDHGVAGCDDDGGDEEEAGADQGHVQLPVPLLREADPALDPQLRRRLRHRDVVKEDDRD